MLKKPVHRCILTFEALLQSITNRYKSLTSVQLQGSMLWICISAENFSDKFSS
jgi:hypothetical protein